jgi:hypothetical protein
VSDHAVSDCHSCLSLRAVLAGLQEEKDRLEAERRKIVCLHCDEAFLWPLDADAKRAVFRQMLDHDAACPENPMVQRLTSLQSALAGLVEQMRHELFRIGNHPALGVQAEIVEQWADTLASLVTEVQR